MTSSQVTQKNVVALKHFKHAWNACVEKMELGIMHMHVAQKCVVNMPCLLYFAI